jgi:hypothetical protein
MEVHADINTNPHLKVMMRLKKQWVISSEWVLPFKAKPEAFRKQQLCK